MTRPIIETKYHSRFTCFRPPRIWIRRAPAVPEVWFGLQRGEVNPLGRQHRHPLRFWRSHPTRQELWLPPIPNLGRKIIDIGRPHIPHPSLSREGTACVNQDAQEQEQRACAQLQSRRPAFGCCALPAPLEHGLHAKNTKQCKPGNETSRESWAIRESSMPWIEACDHDQMQSNDAE